RLMIVITIRAATATTTAPRAIPTSHSADVDISCSSYPRGQVSTRWTILLSGVKSKGRRRHLRRLAAKRDPGQRLPHHALGDQSGDVGRADHRGKDLHDVRPDQVEVLRDCAACPQQLA